MLAKFNRFELKRQLPLIAGILLSIYFSFHLLYGPRSIGALHELKGETVRLEQELQTLSYKRKKVEKKVVMLRPETVDPDLLEERARVMLGYLKPGEAIIVPK